MKRITLLEFEYSNKWPTDRSLENTLTSLAAHGYKCFREEQDTWTKVILKPGMERQAGA